MYIIILLSLKYIHRNVLIVYKLCFYVYEEIFLIRRDECILKSINIKLCFLYINKSFLMGIKYK